MDKEKFIEKFDCASDTLDMEYINHTVTGCLNRCANASPQYACGHSNLISTMEELGELTAAVSRRMSGRTEDNYEVLEEIADVLLNILCMGRIFGFSPEDIKKAVNVKADREAERIRQHFGRTLHLTCGDVTVMDEDIDDIMDSAMSGCTYWAERADVIGEYLGEYANEQISRGGGLKFYPIDEKDSYILDKEKFCSGLKQWLDNEGADWMERYPIVMDGQIDPGQIDACMADTILQYALFGELIYG